MDKFGNLSFIRGIYRSLLKSGRTYAAFEKDQVLPLVEKLAERQEILDPMAGYGTLMSYCSGLNVSTFLIENNPPAYLWEVLTHPGNAEKFIMLAERLKESKSNWPKPNLKVSVSNDWFPEESKIIILQLIYLCRDIINEMQLAEGNNDEICLAFLLPFVGRFSSSVPGNIVTNVKRGGICIYIGWQTDFIDYIDALVVRLKLNSHRSTCKAFRHQIMYGDCRTIELPERRFAAMITSPPFPNSQDYSSMFAPENALLAELTNKKLIVGYPILHPLIGSVHVSSIKAKNGNSGYKITSSSAKKFLSDIEKFKVKTKSKSAKYDIEVYYLHYFASYFSELEKAFANISKALSKDFKGYVIVVNNTARNIVVPISGAVVETWRSLGFKAEMYSTREMSHLGSINPRATGLRARHMEYTIKVWRK